MHDILFSTIDHPGLKNELRVKVSITKDWKIEIGCGNGMEGIGMTVQAHTVLPADAFPMFTRYLQHLWTETVAEPIPEILRRPLTLPGTPSSP